MALQPLLNLSPSRPDVRGRGGYATSAVRIIGKASRPGGPHGAKRQLSAACRRQQQTFRRSCRCWRLRSWSSCHSRQIRSLDKAHLPAILLLLLLLYYLLPSTNQLRRPAGRLRRTRCHPQPRPLVLSHQIVHLLSNLLLLPFLQRTFFHLCLLLPNKPMRCLIRSPGTKRSHSNLVSFGNNMREKNGHWMITLRLPLVSTGKATGLSPLKRSEHRSSRNHNVKSK